jgi:hypothetical protein
MGLRWVLLNSLELFGFEVLQQDSFFRLKSQHLERQTQELGWLLISIYAAYRVQRYGFVDDGLGCKKIISSVTARPGAG